MEKDSGIELRALRVDGGASANNFDAVSGGYAAEACAAPGMYRDDRTGSRLSGGTCGRLLEKIRTISEATGHWSVPLHR